MTATARKLYEREYLRARDEGVETGLPLLLWGLVETEVYAGNWDRAEELAEEGYALAQDSDSGLAIVLMSAVRGLVHTCRGRVDAGHVDAERAVQLGRDQGIGLPVLVAIQSFGVSCLAVGDAQGAHDLLGPHAEWVRAAGIAEPGVLRFLPDEIEALVRLGDLTAAAQLLDPFQARSRELGRGWGIAASARCRGLLLAAGRDMAAAEESLAVALQAHQRLPLPFEHARTLLVAGEVARRARHKSVASAHLHAALATFEHLGAPLWAGRAHAELDRLGLRRTTPSSTLTENEQRVADLVAEGRTNAQVAAELFMAQRTVEAHLSHIYRKLGVTSRTEMSRIHTLAARPDSTTAPPKRA